MMEVKSKMNKLKSLKKSLGGRYSFENPLPERDVLLLLKQNPAAFSDTLAASLTAGCLRLEAVLYPAPDRVILGYDVFVKDSPDNSDWICYDNLPDPVEPKTGLSEHEMFRVLDCFAEEKGLSYTECNFETVAGKSPRQVKEA
jgi:hypothetical protein